MLDVHPPHHATHSWKDFFIHIATISVGLLIAVGLEQSVEAIHHRQERHHLEDDLRAEALGNRQVIGRDLKIQLLQPWFRHAATALDSTLPEGGQIRVTLPPAPCVAGSIGTAQYRYFAPSEAVWATARESGLVVLLPVDRARTYARLGHNYELLALQREEVYRGCASLLAMQQRLGTVSADGSSVTWKLRAEQSEKLAQVLSDTSIAIKGMCFRLRWSDAYEQILAEGDTRVDVNMMKLNQQAFEDEQNPFPATIR